MGKALIDQDSADRLPVPLEDHEVAAVPVPALQPVCDHFKRSLIEQFEQPIGRPSRQRFFAGAFGASSSGASIPVMRTFDHQA